jgi:hypothetical protein
MFYWIKNPKNRKRIEIDFLKTKKEAFASFLVLWDVKSVE